MLPVHFEKQLKFSFVIKIKSVVLVNLIFCGILFLSCGSGTLDSSTLSRDSDNDSIIILQIKKDKNFKNTRKKNGTYIISEKLQFINEKYQEISLLSKIESISDTVITIDSKTPIWLTYQFPAYLRGRKLSYYAIPGDTITINFKDGLAFFLNTAKPENMFINKFWEILYSSDLYTESFKKSAIVYRDEEHIAKRKNIFTVANRILDSLYKKSSNSNANLYNATKKILAYELGVDLLMLLNTTPQTAILSEIETKSFSDSLLLNNSVYRQFLIANLYKNLFVPQVPGKKSVQEDFKKGFDISLKGYNGIVRDFLLTYCLREIYNTDQRSDFYTYKAKYDTIVTNPAFKKEIELFVAEPILKNRHDAIKLMTGATFSLDSLLKSFKGKFIYIDFWASWCVPCRVAMPASHELREKFKQNDIVFIYLSTDKDFNKWSNASREELLNDYYHSYLLMNPEKAGITKMLAVETIPRYVIIGRKGEVLYREAPAPGDDKLTSIFKKELSKD